MDAGRSLMDGGGEPKGTSVSVSAKAESSRRSRLHVLKFCFVDGLRHFYRRLGRSLAKYPFMFIVATLCFAIMCAGGLRHARMAPKVKDGYVPTGARSRRESRIYESFHAEAAGRDPYVANVIVRAADGGSLLRRPHMDAVHRLLHYATDEINVTSAQEGGGTVAFADFCATFGGTCALNLVVDKMHEALAADPPAYDTRIDYPVSTMGGQEFNIAMHFFGVERYGDGETAGGGNGTVGGGGRVRLKSVRMIMMYFRAFVARGPQLDDARRWEVALFRFIYETEHTGDFALLDILGTGDRMIETELAKVINKLAVFLTFGFVLMFVFVVASVVGITMYHGVFRPPQLLVALAALIAPLLSFAASFGLFAWIGTEIYPMMVLAPYLILAIGVDDSFLMMHSWYRCPASAVSSARAPAAGRDSAGDKAMAMRRLAHVLDDVGPSITVTSLTNSLAFGMGAFTGTPVIERFCAATCVGMTLCFVFELTFFAAALAWVGRRDAFHSERRPGGGGGGPETALGDAEKTSHDEGDDGGSQRHTTLQRLSSRAVDVYAGLLTWPPVVLLVAVLTAAMWAMAVWGALSITTVVHMQQILPAGSPVLRAFDSIDTVAWKSYYPVEIVVNRAPQLPNRTQYDQFMRMVDDFEHATNNSLGEQYTKLWLRDYERYVRRSAVLLDLFSFGVGDDADEPAALSYDSLPQFLDIATFYKDFVHYHVDNASSVSVSSFVWMAASERATDWDGRVQLMLAWRRIADSYPQFNVSVWSSVGDNCDAILNLRPIAQETVMITLCVMAAVCLLFIPSACGVLCASCAIASTTVCVMGSLSWWHIDLDPMSVAAILMAIGFSVDFTAHTSYHYQRAVLDGCATPRATIVHTLESVAFPMVQAGASTLLTVLPLCAHGDYAPEVLLKAIVALVLCGLLHGLVILPTALGALPQSQCCMLPAADAGAEPTGTADVPLVPTAAAALGPAADGAHASHC